MTFARLGLWDDKPFMAIMKGESADLTPEQRRAINAQTDPTWPHVHARSTALFDEFLSVFPCNHVQGTVGDQVRALTYLVRSPASRPWCLAESCRPQHAHLGAGRLGDERHVNARPRGAPFFASRGHFLRHRRGGVGGVGPARGPGAAGGRGCAPCA